MDYKKIIAKALSEENWDEVIKYATEAKSGMSYFLNIKPGYINLIKSASRISEALEEIGITILDAYDKADVGKLVKDGLLTAEKINSKPIMVEASRSTAVAKLTTLGYPVQTIKINETNKYLKDKEGNDIGYETTITVANSNTGEKVKFKIKKGDYRVEKGVIKAYLREKNIDSILND
jgi:hypothetical protein